MKDYQFPTKLGINLQKTSGLTVTKLHFSDTLGAIIPDSYSEARYMRYYRSIVDEFSSIISTERIEYNKLPNESVTNTPAIPDYRIWAAFGIIFFIPFALIALWHANNAQKEIALGNIDISINQANKSKLWLIATFVVGILIDVFCFVYDIIKI